MSFVNQRGCHFLSDSVLFGDPMFGKMSDLCVCIPNIKEGYWYINVSVDNNANRDGKARIVLQFSKCKITETTNLLGKHLMYSVSGYLGIFDEMRFQAGWANRCQRWFEYCQHSVGNSAIWSVITGGVVFKLDGHAEEALCRVYSDEMGSIVKLEMCF